MSGSDKVDTKNQTSTGGKAGPVQGGANTADSGTVSIPDPLET